MKTFIVWFVNDHSMLRKRVLGTVTTRGKTENESCKISKGKKRGFGVSFINIAVI